MRGGGSWERFVFCGLYAVFGWDCLHLVRFIMTTVLCVGGRGGLEPYVFFFLAIYISWGVGHPVALFLSYGGES